MSSQALGAVVDEVGPLLQRVAGARAVTLYFLACLALRRLGAAALRCTCAVCGLLSHKSPRSAPYWPAGEGPKNP